MDAYAVEDWIFESRFDDRWDCAFTDVETGACADPSVIQPDRSAYHDPYYDKDGLDLDRMPQGLNKGSPFFFLDTLTPDYAKDYFRPNAYHTYGTDKVIDGAIVPRAVEDGGSWRITDPDTGDWDGIDYARTWGGRYRFHFIDLGAAPNDFESASWAGRNLGMSSDYLHGDPPVWQYSADPLWQQDGDTCKTGGHPGRRDGPALQRQHPVPDDAAAGSRHRLRAVLQVDRRLPVPPDPARRRLLARGVELTDFYRWPQWVEGTLTNAPWYGTWWTDPDKLYKIGDVADGTQQDDTLRWLSRRRRTPAGWAARER